MKKIIFKNQEQKVEILYQKEISKISENFPEHGKMFFVCDERVLEKNPQMNKLLNENVYLVKSPEKEKDLQSTIRILKFLKDNGCNRNDHLIAIGGGATTDLGGFASSIYMRGINLIIIPTSLLGQVDASVGGKTGVNFESYKNLVGSFFNPKKIIVCTNFLESLDEQEYLNGLAEILKHAIITSDNDVDTLLKNIEKITSRDNDFLEEQIRRSVEIKTKIVTEDFLEAEQRKFLNFGHTFAHGIESINQNNPILHGHAVIIGMKMALEFSYQEKFLDEESFTKSKNLLNSFKYNLSDIELDADKILSAMELDKKNDGNGINLVLLKKIGVPFLSKSNEPNKILKFLINFIDNFE